MTGTIDVSAALGPQGSILIDPTDLTIVADGTGADNAIVSGTGIIVSSLGAAATVDAGVIANLTGAVTLQAANNLTVSADIIGAKASTLAFEAGVNILISNTITMSGAGGNISLTAAKAGAGFATNPAGAININQALDAGNGTITLNAGTGGMFATASGVLTAAVLTGSSTGGVSLTAANKVGTLGAFGATGSIQFTDTSALVIAGAVSGSLVIIIGQNNNGRFHSLVDYARTGGSRGCRSSPRRAAGENIDERNCPRGGCKDGCRHERRHGCYRACCGRYRRSFPRRQERRRILYTAGNGDCQSVRCHIGICAHTECS